MSNETMQLRSTSVRCSRKEHTCMGCYLKIPKGSPYTQYAGLYEGEFSSGHICTVCEAFTKSYPYIFDDEGWESGTLPEYREYAEFKKQYNRTDRGIVFIGDTHGNFGHQRYEFMSRKNVDYIHVGDYGMLFGTHDTLNIKRSPDIAKVILNSLNTVLIESNSRIYIGRGNHDNPEFWVNSDKWSLSNIIFVPDYTIVTICGQRVLFVGGAISVDRKQYFGEGVLWWSNEVFKYDGDRIGEILDSEERLDIVVTHTAPTFCQPIGINQFVRDYAINDKFLLIDVQAERESVSRLYMMLNTKFSIKLWVYGHFHTGYTSNYNGTTFTMMKSNEYSKKFFYE